MGAPQRVRDADSACGGRHGYALARLATGIGGVGFVKEVAQSAALAYATKDAELAARRDEMRQLASNVELTPRAPRASTRKAAAADVTDVKAKAK